jgi:hypothetical protein
MKSLQNLVLMNHGVTYQNLDSSLKKYDARKDGSSDVCFVTEVGLDQAAMLKGNARLEKLGLVVWFDRQEVQSLLHIPSPTGIPEDYEAPLRSLYLALKEVKKTGACNWLPKGLKLDQLREGLDAIFEVAT